MHKPQVAVLRAGTYLVVGLSFLPYLGLPVGANSSFSASSIFATILAPLWIKSRLMRRHFTWLCLFIFTGLAVGSTARQDVPSIIPSVLLISNLIPGLFFGAVAGWEPRLLLTPLRIFLVATSCYSLVQKYLFLDQGVLPFLNYYSLPGISSVQGKIETVTRYVRRPFAFFPEASYLAATLVLATTVLLLCVAITNEQAKLDLLLVVLVGYVVFVSGSGVTVGGLILLTILACLVLLKARVRALFLLVALPASGLAGQLILFQRENAFNWSWYDRSASILGAFRYVFSSPENFLFGVGTGQTTVLFQKGKISLSGLTYFHELPDIYSTLGRFLVEGGVIAGLPMIAFWLFQIWRAFTIRNFWPAAVATAGIWLICGGLATSYDSAVWVWALPIICAGVAPMTFSRQQIRKIGKTGENFIPHK